MRHVIASILTLLLLALTVSGLADAPETVLGPETISGLEQTHTGFKVFAAYRCDSENIIVSMHKQGANLLVWQRNGRTVFSGSKPVPQGNPVYVQADPACTLHTSHFSLIQGVNEDGGGTNDSCTACHFYLDRLGDMRLSVYRVKGRDIYVTPDSLTYDGTVVNGTIENRLNYLNLARIPATASAARKRYTTAPDIPAGTLSAQSIGFPANKTYPVYSAPDAHSLRGAGGKAKVSTNDWIQVFGRDGNWILIQYAIGSDRFRIGYITYDALPTDADVPDLAFAGTAAVLNAPAAVTDDPLNSRTELASLDTGSRVLALGTMGSWTYAEGDADGKTFRGFIPTSSLSGSSVVTSLSEARELLKGVWTVYAGGAGSADTLEFRADGTVHGQIETRESNLVEIMRTSSDWDGTWSLDTYDAAYRRYWNEPEFELTVQRAEGVKRYGLRICWEPFARGGARYALILSDAAHTTGLVLCR